MSVNVRFAPSPTGLLHVGNVRAALLNWLFSRQQNGSFLLRFDDTDISRSRPEFVDAIRRDLTWLGLEWDKEAKQSERLVNYQKVADQLRQDERLYPCYETPEELSLKRRMQLGRGMPPVYDRAALSLSDEDRADLEAKGRKPHWRFLLDREKRVEWDDLIKGPQTVDPNSLSDPVLIRADGTFLYMLPSTVDDIDFEISHIVRGEDHVTNTGEQIQIFEALGATVPLFGHYSLLKASDGGKFSKRAESGSIAALRDEADIEPEAIISLLARLGSSDPIEAFIDYETLIKGFDFSRFSRSSAIFDDLVLDHLNARILHMLPYDQVKNRPQMRGMDESFWLAVRSNLEHFEDVALWRQVVEGPVSPVISEKDRGFLDEALTVLPDTLDDESWKNWTNTLKQSSGRKGRSLFMPLRQALTGQDRGPEMAALLPMIGRERAEMRLKGHAA